MHLLLQSIDEIKESEYPLFLLGTGTTSQRLTEFYEKYDIEIAGYLISDEYYIRDKWAGRLFCGKNVYAAKAYTEYDGELFDLVAAHTELTKDYLNRLCRDRIHKLYVADPSSVYLFPDVGNIFDDMFWKDNKDSILSLREDLCDQKSIEAFDDYIYQKLSGEYFKPFDKGQYFDSDIIGMAKGEVFVDCGAYNGDTMDAFISIMRKEAIDDYRIFAYEADKANSDKIVAKYGNDSRIKVFDIGVWNRSDVIYFEDGSNVHSHAISNGDTTGMNQIRVDSIDNTLNGESVTFIKMDIEGSEVEALHGAEKTIRMSHPKLAISVYHKRDDLINIPSLIKSISPDYRFYFRNYHQCGSEAVLYAV